MQRSVLHESGEGEDEADGDEQVHGGDVGDLRQGLSGDGAERRHGEHGGDSWMGGLQFDFKLYFHSLIIVICVYIYADEYYLLVWRWAGIKYVLLLPTSFQRCKLQLYFFIFRDYFVYFCSVLILIFLHI